RRWDGSGRTRRRACDRVPVAVPLALADGTGERTARGCTTTGHDGPATARDGGSLFGPARRSARCGSSARKAVAGDSAVRLGRTGALPPAALPAARRTVLPSRFPDTVRAPGHPAARLGRVGQDGCHGHARRR